MPRRRILIPMKANRSLADILNQFERTVPFLFTQRITQHASEKTDILTQWQVLIIHQFIIGALIL